MAGLTGSETLPRDLAPRGEASPRVAGLPGIRIEALRTLPGAAPIRIGWYRTHAVGRIEPAGDGYDLIVHAGDLDEAVRLLALCAYAQHGEEHKR